MSVQQLAAVFGRSRSRGGARLVLLSIANHDGDGGSWPTIATLARESGLCERSVHEALRNLKADGELKIHPNAGGTMDWRSDRRPNRYEIVLPNGVEESATPRPNGVEDSSERGGNLARHGVEETATQTIQEQSTKSSTRVELGEGFKEFYAVYPRRTGKVAALKAFEKAVAREVTGGLEAREAMKKIKIRVERYAALVRNTEEKFIPHPSTWLSEGRYDDDALLPENFNGRKRVNPNAPYTANDGVTYL